jgi:hypothetical protein
VFLSGESEAAELIDAIAASADAAVRAAFVDSYVFLFARAPGQPAQDALLRGLRRLFENPPRAIASKLANAQTYAFFGPAKLLQLVPALVDFAPALRGWRDIAQIAQTFLSFPPEVLRPCWRSVAGSMLPLFAANAHPLAPEIQAFCARFAGALEADARREFIEDAIAALAGAGWPARRIVAGIVVSAAAILGPADAAIVHAAMRARIADGVAAVVAGAMAPLGTLRQLWALKGEVELEREVVEMFAAARDVRDEIVQRAWTEAWEASAVRIGASALPRLSTRTARDERGRTVSGLTPIKAVASLQGSVRRPGSLLGMVGTGKPRRRTFQVADLRGEGSASYSGPGMQAQRISEPGAAVIGGPLIIGPGMSGGRRASKGGPG